MFDWIREQIEAATGKPSDEQVDVADSNEKFLIVGLGNPGREYRNTRHSIGFMAADRLADVHGMQSSRVEQKAIVGKARIDGRSIIIAKPQTFMNKSGESVGALCNYYKIPNENVLIIYDELDIPFGTIRLRKKGGAGGHNGIRSIIERLGNEFPRMRLGIGRPPGKMPAHAYVLQSFHERDEAVLDVLLDEAVAAVHTFLQDGIELAMTQHNGQVNDS